MATQDEPKDPMKEFVELLSNLTPRIPVDVDLWSTKEIGLYLKRSPEVVAERIVTLPDFPQAIRLPSGKGRGRPLWKARQVIAWAEKYQESRVA